MADPFNEQQLEAIQHVHGPMLVVAGAGTGKTRVMVERMARLLESGHAQPQDILAVSYTEKSAQHLRERLKTRCGSFLESRGLEAPQVKTFHGFCYGLLKRHDAIFELLEEIDLWIYLRRRIEHLGLKHYSKAAAPADFLTGLLKFFDRCNDELVDAADYSAYVDKVVAGEMPLTCVLKPKDHDALTRDESLARCQEIARVFHKVEQMLGSRNLGSFGALITRAIDLLGSRPEVAEAEQKRFVLIDEFQDSNVAQITLAKLLAGDAQNIFAVGDPDQAIYRFRGASSGAFDEFLGRFPQTRHINLVMNYRSSESILKCAYAAISLNPEISSTTGSDGPVRRQPLEPGRKAGAEVARVGIVIADSNLEEAAGVAEKIRALQQHDGCRWSDFAVLYRTHSHRTDLLRELATRGIPFQVKGLDLLETAVLRDLTALLRCVNSTRDDVSLFRVLLMRQFSVDIEKLAELCAAATKGTPVADTLALLPEGKRLLDRLAYVRVSSKSERQKISRVLRDVMTAFGFSPSDPAVRAFQRFVALWEAKRTTETGLLREFVEYLDFFIEAAGRLEVEGNYVAQWEHAQDGDPDIAVAPLFKDAEPEDAVQLMSVHTAKGLEFPHVFVIHVTSNSFPSLYRAPLIEFPSALRELPVAQSDDGALHQEEERRLFYVSMTRARDSLTLSSKKGTSGTQPVPSRYLRELTDAREIADCIMQTTAPPYRADLAAAGDAGSDWLRVDLPPRGATRTLSASGLETYKTCPLKYKLNYGWKLPTDVSAALQFGNLLHDILRDYYDSVLAQRPHSREQVLANFTAAMDSVAFADPHQQDLYRKQGLMHLEEFVALAERAPADVTATEKSFVVEIGGVQVRGRIDRIDRTESGGVAIVDYKTGNPKDEKKARESLQLSIYMLAAQKLWQQNVERVSFYNTANNTLVSAPRSAKQLAAAEETVRDLAQKIKDGEFEPRPGFHCGYCAYQVLCPATEERIHAMQMSIPAAGAH